MKRVKEFYLSDYPKMSYFDRFCFEYVNGFDQLDFSRVKPNMNPFKWCVLDVVKIVYFSSLLVALPLIAIITCAYDARINKLKYTSGKYVGCFMSDMWVPNGYQAGSPMYHKSTRS